MYKGEIVTTTGKKELNNYQFNAKSKKVINLATLDWPPYIGEKLCGKGWVFQFAVATFVSQGFQVNVQFLPWPRAVKMVELGILDVLFPEYHLDPAKFSEHIANKKRSELLVQSDEFSGGIISFLKRNNSPDKFTGDLKSLIGEQIGVVRGYQNTPELDAMISANFFNIYNAVDDLQLVQLLHHNRVNYIVGDPKVLHFTVDYSDLPSSEKTAILSNIIEVKHPLEYNALHFAFNLDYASLSAVLRETNLVIKEFKDNGELERFENMPVTVCEH